MHLALGALLSRCTSCGHRFECASLQTVLRVLEALSTMKGWSLLSLKNRLMLEFDADETGGYRDMLTNMRCEATGHLCEVQLTLVPLLHIKQSGGHAA